MEESQYLKGIQSMEKNKVVFSFGLILVYRNRMFVCVFMKIVIKSVIKQLFKNQFSKLIFIFLCFLIALTASFNTVVSTELLLIKEPSRLDLDSNCTLNFTKPNTIYLESIKCTLKYIDP